MSEPVFSEAQFHAQRLEIAYLSRECGELRAEIERMNDEISYYESLCGDACQDWPHRDGRYREWLCAKLRERDEALAEIGQLRERNARLQFGHQSMATRYTQLEDEIERLLLRINQLETECGHLQADLSEQRAEISRLNDEISYYESLTGDECQDWPHRDGRYREWLYARLRERDKAVAEIERLRGLLAAGDREQCCEQVKEQYRLEIERLQDERDDAREAARWLFINLCCVNDTRIGAALEHWPWLTEEDDE